MLILCLDQASQEYYISATQSHDKSKAIQYKNRPFQILIFTGFSESQNKVEPYRKKSMFIRVYGILAVKFCTIFVIYLTIYSYTNPLKIRIYTIRWSIPWKHLQVHASPYKYCYLNASKCDCIVIFLTICAWRGGGYFLLAIKTLPLLPQGVLINSGIFTCPGQIHGGIYRKNYFPIW